jgi:glutamate carboxypeptidase
LNPEEVRQAIDAIHEDVLSLLTEMVRINSFSYNTAGIREVAELAASHIPSLFQVDSIQPNLDDRIWIHRCHASDQIPILLSGHLDTVHPPGECAGDLEADGEFLCGPGVADMKGGVAVILGALWVLDQLGRLPDIPIAVAFTGDEEIGSIHSRKRLKDLAQQARLGLVFESAGPNGEVVLARRGVRVYRLTVEGEEGHSGYDVKQKQSALIELSHQILRLEGLNDSKLGLSVNVGMASGGTAVNVIPGHAEAKLEVRFWDEDIGDSAAERILASLAAPKVSGMNLRLERTHARPVMAPTKNTESLFEAVREAGADLGWTIGQEVRTAASDANVMSSAGLACLDGFGPRGEMGHSPRERILAKTVRDRLELTVHLLWRLRDWQPKVKQRRFKLKR